MRVHDPFSKRTAWLAQNEKLDNADPAVDRQLLAYLKTICEDRSFETLTRNALRIGSAHTLPARTIIPHQTRIINALNSFEQSYSLPFSYEELYVNYRKRLSSDSNLDNTPVLRSFFNNKIGETKRTLIDI